VAGADVAGSTKDAYNAHLIKIELPLTNGDTPVLEIRPQEPSFRSFASRCNALPAGPQ